MDILVIGAGEVGYHLVKHLSREAHRVTLVDRDSDALGRAGTTVDIQTVQGHGASHEVLERAGAAKADLVCAVTNNDELNMLAGLLTRKMGARRAVVRIHAADHVHDDEFFYKDVLDFDLTISPDGLAALEILRICRGQNAAPVESFAGGRLQMRRLEILPDSPVAGRSLAKARIPAKVLCSGVVRGPEVSIPNGEFVLEAGDFAMLIGVPEALDKAERVLGGKRSLPKRVMISGGGSIAFIVARDLMHLGVSVRLIESDEGRAEQLSQLLEGADVVRGEGTNIELLVEEGIKKADHFISLEPKDEVNLLACQLAKQLGAQHTTALLQRGDYSRLEGRFGVDNSISPRRLVARRIAHFVRSAPIGSIARIHHGAAEVLDRLIAPDWKHAGAPLHEIPFPVGTIVGGIIRGQEVIVPSGDTRIEAADHLILFCLRDVLGDLQGLFETAEA